MDFLLPGGLPATDRSGRGKERQRQIQIYWLM